MIKTGVHGCNGLNAKISYKIYQVYVIPRLLYGLDVVLLNKGQLDEANTVIAYENSKFHSVSTHRFIPFIAEIERRQLGLFYSIFTSENATLQQLWKRQISFKKGGSFFEYIAGLVERYCLPSPEEILLLSKEGWKLLVKRTLGVFLDGRSRGEVNAGTMYLDSLHMAFTHPVWDTVKSSRLDVMRAVVKVCILTGLTGTLEEIQNVWGNRCMLYIMLPRR